MVIVLCWDNGCSFLFALPVSCLCFLFPFSGQEITPLQPPIAPSHPNSPPLRSLAPPSRQPLTPVVLTVCERPPRSPLPLLITSPKSGSVPVGQPMAGRARFSPSELPLFSHTIGQTQSVSPGRPGVYAGRQTVRLAPDKAPEEHTHIHKHTLAYCTWELLLAPREGCTHRHTDMCRSYSHSLLPRVCPQLWVVKLSL